MFSEKKVCPICKNMVSVKEMKYIYNRQGSVINHVCKKCFKYLEAYGYYEPGAQMPL